MSVGPQRLALTLDDGRVSAGCSVDGDFAAARNPSQAEETIRTQISKTGDTIYAVSGVEIRCDEPRFVPVAVLNALRRTCIEKLDGNRSAAYPGPVRRPENRQAVFPQTALTGADNVTNPLAERFYREHGVETVEAGYDLNDRFDGVRVMRMRYCLRREIGQCLRERPDYRGRLFIETGRNRYELMFDALTNVVDILSMIPYIVPGTVLGIALLIGFNKPPLLISGTMLIMVVALIIRRLPYTIRSSVAILQQIPMSIEEAAISLGASKMKAFFRITVPMMASGIISGAILSWVTMISELSTAIILYTGKTKTLTVAIYTEVIRGNYGTAAALSTIMTILTVISLLAFSKLNGGKDISL